jgi:hypothetical protein
MLKAISLQRAQEFLKSFVINEARKIKDGLTIYHFIENKEVWKN